MSKTVPVFHFLIFMILLLLTGVLYYFTVNQIRDEKMTQAEVDNLVENREKLISLRRQLPNINAELNNWLQALPEDEDSVARFATLLEQLARDRGLSITLDFEDFPEPVIIGGKTVPGIGLTILLEGSFEGVRDFMTQLTSVDYFYVTDKITILKHDTRPGVKASFVGSLMMNINL